MMEQFLASTRVREGKTLSLATPVTASPSPLQWLFSEVEEEEVMKEEDLLTFATEVIDLASTKSKNSKQIKVNLFAM